MKSSIGREGLRTWLHGPLLSDKVSHKTEEVISYLLYRMYLSLVMLIWESSSGASFNSDVSVIRMGKAVANHKMLPRQSNASQT